jgi:prepilin-type N-terminal cleavage/methylation domain-containing protein
MHVRTGMTLLELTVVLTIIAALTAVTALSISSSLLQRDSRAPSCIAARRRALRDGNARLAPQDSALVGSCAHAVFLPDGRVVTTSARWDPVSGAFDANP